MNIEHEVNITPVGVNVDGRQLPLTTIGANLLREVYHTMIGGYSRFYKMDMLCQLGWVASELLIQAEGKERFVECDDRAIWLFGKHSSICTDRDYQQTIADPTSFFPSPSLFVYTLPNIVTGEIALRNHYHAETAYFMVDNPDLMESYITAFLQTSPHIHTALCGWIDATDIQTFLANVWLIKK